MRPLLTTRPLSPVERGLITGLGVILGVALAGGYVLAAFSTYRFSHYMVVADARILDSDLGCFGPIGSGTGLGTGTTITYQVEFRYRAGTHRTEVVRPCDVIPPDFGRGRGSIWVEYDREHPDRIRVLNDHRVETWADGLAVVLIGYLVVVAALVIRWRLAQRKTGDR